MNIYNKRTQNGNRASDNKKKTNIIRNGSTFSSGVRKISAFFLFLLCLFHSFSFSFFLIPNFVTFTSFTVEVYNIHSLLVESHQKTSFSNQSTMSHIETSHRGAKQAQSIYYKPWNVLDQSKDHKKHKKYQINRVPHTKTHTISVTHTISQNLHFSIGLLCVCVCVMCLFLWISFCSEDLSSQQMKNYQQ